jgi:hypothetical protein
MSSLRRRTLVVAALGALFGAAACSSVPPESNPGTPDAGLIGDTGNPTADGTGQTSSSLTYYKDVLPLVQKNCQTCHVPGGIGPFPLTTYKEVKAQIGAMVAATQAGIMPPWLPADDCRPLHGSRKLSDGDLKILSEWKEAGTPEGDPRDAPPDYVPPTLPEPDRGWPCPAATCPSRMSPTTTAASCWIRT